MSETVSISLPSSRYLVLGLGLTGQAVARWLARQGCGLVIADTRPDLNVDSLMAELAGAQVACHLGRDLGPE